MPPSIEIVRQELRTALAADLGEALVLLRQRLSPAPRVVSNVVLQSGRYHQADSDWRKGNALLPERDRVFNSVRTALLDVVNQLTEADLAQPASDPDLAQKMGLPVAANQQFLSPLFVKLRVGLAQVEPHSLGQLRPNRREPHFPQHLPPTAHSAPGRPVFFHQRLPHAAARKFCGACRVGDTRTL